MNFSLPGVTFDCFEIYGKRPRNLFVRLVDEFFVRTLLPGRFSWRNVSKSCTFQCHTSGSSSISILSFVNFIFFLSNYINAPVCFFFVLTRVVIPVAQLLVIRLLVNCHLTLIRRINHEDAKERLGFSSRKWKASQSAIVDLFVHKML